MSCILTLPPYQRQGYGRLLIDFSEYTTPRLLFFFSSFLSLSPASGSSNRSALARARRPVDDDIRPNEIERMVELGTGVCRNASVVSVAWPLVDVAVAAIERPCPARATGTNSTRSSLARASRSPGFPLLKNRSRRGSCPAIAFKPPSLRSFFSKTLIQPSSNTA